MAVAHSGASLGEVLQRDGIISPAQLSGAIKAQRETSHSIGRVLVDLGYITEDHRVAALRKSFGFDVIKLSTLKTDPAVLSLIPPRFALKHRILPIRQDPGGALIVAMEDPSDVLVIDAIKTQVGMAIKPYIAATDELSDALSACYAKTEDEAEPADEPVQAEPAPPGPGLAYRIARQAFFPIMCFAPLGGFFLIVSLSDSVFQWLLSFAAGRFFDIGLYTVLIWALWSIILFEINGLIFKPEEESEKDEEVV